MKEERLMQEVVTKKYFIVSKYKDLGNGKFIAIDKRPITKEDLNKFGLSVENEVKG